jgi:hypothetical protein
MKLNNPITVNANGSEIVLDDLDIVIFDHPSRKTVLVRLHPAARPLMVWRGPEYDNAGDYTQAQLEDRVLEVLGEDLQNGLQNLFNIEIL